MRVKSSTIRHIAILAGEPGEILGVYKTAYGLNEVARNGEAIYLSDGHIWFFCRHGPAEKRVIILASKWKTSKAPVSRRPPPGRASHKSPLRGDLRPRPVGNPGRPISRLDNLAPMPS